MNANKTANGGADQFEHRPGVGYLFANSKTKPNQPDYRGHADAIVDGQPVRIRLAGWLKVSRNGNEYLSLKAEVLK